MIETLEDKVQKLAGGEMVIR